MQAGAFLPPSSAPRKDQSNMLTFITVLVASYIWHALGVTIGYHRLISHRSFSCPKWVEYFWVMAGYLAFEGSPIWWATIHRAHHRYVDTPLDPHAPKFGLKNSYYGWLTRTGYASHIDPQLQSKDLLKDPLYRFLDQGGNWHRAHFVVFFIGLAFRVVLLACFGWQVALASLLGGVGVLQIPLMLNVICHIPRLGYKNYALNDDSVNVWWVGILAMGEGWHNNHHAAPGSAKTGMKPWEIDVSWLLISLMQRLGLTSRVNVWDPSKAPASAARSVDTHSEEVRLAEPRSADPRSVDARPGLVAASRKTKDVAAA
jgi:stearoyl-CoA desaturase (delta-9 desaturase)